jgi:hypothetical protein
MNEVGYTKMEACLDNSYFDMPENLYRIFQNNSSIDFWQVYQQFLNDAINEGKSFQLAQSFKRIVAAPDSTTAMGVAYILSQGYILVIDNGIETLIPPKQEI